MISSLGGDTAAAAEASNSAITDMSDNANKMGTSMESIQNAYQGFAKGSYVMLDNLKLGYGGTQTEMERLLSDATKISGVKYDINNLSDVTAAIHTIQTEMGITGTTAEEAEQTISGSIDMTKSAYMNLITGIGDPNADVETLVNNLTDSFAHVVENISPVIESIVAAVPTVMNALITAIVGMLPQILTTGVEIIVALIQGIAEALPTLVPIMVDCVLLIVDALIENLPLLIDAAIQIIVALALGLIEALPELTNEIPQIIDGIVAALIDALPLIIAAGFQLFVAIIQEAPAIISTVIGIIPTLLAALGGAIAGRVGDMASSGFELFVSIIQQAGSIVSSIIGIVPTIITAIVEKFSGFFTKMKNIGKNIATGLRAGAIDKLSTLLGYVAGIPGKVLAKLSGIKDKMASAGRNIVYGIWNGVSGKVSWLLEKIGGFAGGIVKKVKKILKINSPSHVFRDEIGSSIPEGTAVGIAKGTHFATAAVTKLANKVISDSKDKIKLDGFGVIGEISTDMTVSSQVSDSVKNGMAKLKASAALNQELSLDDMFTALGDKKIEYNQEININQPVSSSPSAISRAIRRSTQKQGLAGV